MSSKIILNYLSIFWLSLLAVKAQTTPKILQNFIKEVRSKGSDYEYFYSHYTTAKDCEHSKSIQLVKAQLDGMKTLLEEDANALNNIHYLSHKEIPSLIKNSIYIDNFIINDVYLCTYKGEPFVYFLLKNSTIESFSTINKNGHIYFITYCN